jgi:hypothetical protein
MRGAEMKSGSGPSRWDLLYQWIRSDMAMFIALILLLCLLLVFFYFALSFRYLD